MPAVDGLAAFTAAPADAALIDGHDGIAPLAVLHSFAAPADAALIDGHTLPVLATPDMLAAAPADAALIDGHTLGSAESI